MTEMIVAVFDTSSAAEAGVCDLEAAGLSSAVIRRYVKDDPALRAYEGREPHPQGGFWSWLLGEDTPVDDHQVYDRSIAAGGTVVTVTVDEAQVARVPEILNQHAPLHIGERAAEYQIPTAGAGTGALLSGGVAEADMASRLGTSAYDSETGVARDYGRRRYSRHPGRGHAADGGATGGWQASGGSRDDAGAALCHPDSCWGQAASRFRGVTARGIKSHNIYL